MIPEQSPERKAKAGKIADSAVRAIEVLAVLVIVGILFGFAFVVTAEHNPEWSVLRDIADFCRQTYAFIADRPKLQVVVIVLGVIGGVRLLDDVRR